jgi:2'-5' RNA ligase
MYRSLRLFIAIGIPNESAVYINQLTHRVREDALGKIRWVSMEGLRLTVKFLGRTSENLVRPLAEAIEMASAEVNPFMLQIQGAGVFPHMRSPRVLWAGVHGQLTSLTYIKDVLECALERQ